MENLFTKKKLFILAMLSMIVSWPIALATKKNATCEKQSDWHATISCYDGEIKTIDKALEEKYAMLFSDDKTLANSIKTDRNNWYANNEAVCGIDKYKSLTDIHLLCLSLKYKVRHKTLSMYFDLMAGYSKKPVHISGFSQQIDQPILKAIQESGISPVAVLNINDIPIYYVIDDDAQKQGMYFYDSNINQVQKIHPMIGEVVDFVEDDENYLMLLKGRSKTYEITDESYRLLKLQHNGDEYTTSMQRLISTRYYKKDDVCAKSNPASAAIKSASLVKDHRFITDEQGDTTKIEFTLDETDCSVNVAKTVSIVKNI